MGVRNVSAATGVDGGARGVARIEWSTPTSRPRTPDAALFQNHHPVVTPRPSRYDPALVQVIVNDEPRALPAGATVAELIDSLGLGPRRVAVEVNRTLVPRAAYTATPLADGDAVEIIHFVGGG